MWTIWEKLKQIGDKLDTEFTAIHIAGTIKKGNRKMSNEEYVKLFDICKEEVIKAKLEQKTLCK